MPAHASGAPASEPPALHFLGKTALVSGGSRGIGRAICIALAESGASVAINFLSNSVAAAETLKEVEAAAAGCRAQHGSAGQAMVVQGDQSRESDVAAMVAAVAAKLGPIQLLVNNAGIAESREHGELSFADWQQTMRVNVDGPFLLTWAVKDTMAAAGYGRIVNISSIAATTNPRANMIDYGTSKAALNSFTRHASAALAPHGIRVNCVAPGLTETELALSANPGATKAIIAGTPLKRIGQPAEIAAAVRYCLSEDSSFMTGQTIAVDGGRT